MGSTSLSMDTLGTHFQTQKYMQNISSEWTGVPDQRKRIIEPHKTREEEGTRGKGRIVCRTEPALGRWEN